MRNIIALALLSIFMAMPAMAERKFVEGARFCFDPATGNPQGYEWELLDSSVWATIGESSGPCIFFYKTRSTNVMLRAWPVIHRDLNNELNDLDLYNERGPFVSDPSESFSIFENFDLNKNGVVSVGDIAKYLSTFPSAGDAARAASLFGKCVVNKEYVTCS